MTLLATPRTALAVPLVGRGADLIAIGRWLEEGARIVTITGPGGIGKTRVAVEVARRAARNGSNVCAVEARGPCRFARAHVVARSSSDAAEDASLIDAAAQALGIGDEEGAADPIARIGHALRARGDVLLVIDDLGRLASRAAATLGRWLAIAPELCVVIASRERTRLAGEVVHELGPLPEAEALFFACAQRIRAGFSPTDADRDAARAIVAELEGVPLAIELAAARLSVMGTRALLHRVRAGEKAGLERAIETSWAALDATEKRALAEATVFRGGFTLEAAEAVLSRPAAGAVVDVVSSLRDKSLLFARDDAGGDLRLGMYEGVRAQAQRGLEGSPGARDEVEARHAAYYVALADVLAKDAASGERLVAERLNLLAVVERVAAQRAVSARAAEPALRALLALAPALFARGPLRAYEVLLDPAIAATRGSGADPRLLAEVLLVRGTLHRHRGAASRGAHDLVQALGIARTVADVSLEARTLQELGHALEASGDLAGAEDHFRRAADLHMVARAPAAEGSALASLAPLVARRGEADRARAMLERALALHEKLPPRRAEDLRRMAALELMTGRVAAARDAARDSVAASRAAGDVHGEGLALVQLGLIEQRAGAGAAARAAFESAASLFADAGFATLEATAHGHLGVLAREEGRIAEAWALLSAASDALRELAQGPAATLFAEHLVALASRPTGAPPPQPPEEALVVGAGGTWFRPPRGGRVGLERRKPLARIADRLALERVERPGSPLTSRALIDAAWPGEKIVPSAGAHRVRVAVSSLRKLGLPIVTQGEGYALDPALPIVRA